MRGAKVSRWSGMAGLMLLGAGLGCGQKSEAPGGGAVPFEAAVPPAAGEAVPVSSDAAMAAGQVAGAPEGTGSGAPATGPVDDKGRPLAVVPIDPLAASRGKPPPPGEKTTEPDYVPTLAVKPGEGVTVTGSVAFDGDLKKARIRLDVVGLSGSKRKVLHATSLEKVGPFSVTVPKGAGSIELTAFVDPNGDGPGKGEPYASSGVLNIGTSPVKDVVLTLILAQEDHRIKAGGSP